jgi:hypothetical protein
LAQSIDDAFDLTTILRVSIGARWHSVPPVE